MKKNAIIVTLILAIALCFGFTACSKSKDKDKSGDKTKVEDKKDKDEDKKDKDDADDEDYIGSDDVDFKKETDYIVFSVSLDMKIDSDAWLGVIPTGKIYTKEIDADEVDIIYTYCENYDMDGIKSYRFAFDKEYLLSIEDGTYDLVLCSSDDGAKGKVLFQIGLIKNGDKIVLDYANED